MNDKLQKVKEALDNIARIDECQPADYIKDHEFAIKLIKAQQNQAQEALADLNEVMEGEGWQPIETAPKDGVCVYLANDYLMETGYWGNCRSGLKRLEFNWTKTCEHRDLVWKPKYWMPLPKPPQNKTCP